jgi:hypothetical protein
MINERKDPVYEVYDDTEELTYNEKYLERFDASFHNVDDTNKELIGDELTHTFPESEHSSLGVSIESRPVSAVLEPELIKGRSEESVSIIEKPEPFTGETIGL